VEIIGLIPVYSEANDDVGSDIDTLAAERDEAAQVCVWISVTECPVAIDLFRLAVSFLSHLRCSIIFQFIYVV
jgi:hypothetical protein